MKAADENTRHEVIQTVELWGKAVESGDEKNVMAYYEENAVLWGTLAGSRLAGKGAITTYFEKFSKLKNIRAHDFDHFVREGDGIAIDSGSYAFSWEVDGAHVTVPARFTFVLQLFNGQWLITEHHSSLFPPNPFDPAPYIV